MRLSFSGVHLRCSKRETRCHHPVFLGAVIESRSETGKRFAVAFLMGAAVLSDLLNKGSGPQPPGACFGTSDLSLLKEMICKYLTDALCDIFFGKRDVVQVRGLHLIEGVDELAWRLHFKDAQDIVDIRRILCQKHIKASGNFSCRSRRNDHMERNGLPWNQENLSGVVAQRKRKTRQRVDQCKRGIHRERRRGNDRIRAYLSLCKAKRHENNFSPIDRR